MRYFHTMCLLISAMGLSLAVGTTAQASSGKGDKVTPTSPAESKSTPVPAAAPARPSQPLVVIRPRLPEPAETAPVEGTYLSPLDRLKLEAAAAARGEQSSTTVTSTTTVTVQTTPAVAEATPAPVKKTLSVKTSVNEETRAPGAKTLTVKTTVKTETDTPSEPEKPTLVTKTTPAKAPALVKSSSPEKVTTKTTVTERTTFTSRTTGSVAPGIAPGGRLARVTAYWACEGDYYTRHGIAATGVRLHDGHCAVDPNIIPYGSVVTIAGVGKFLAVDTGSAVISRTAAREAGHTSAERNAIVVDVFFDNRSDGEQFASRDAKWASVSWWTPTSTASQAKQARGLFAEEDWTKINGKQL